jgi:hypothetical protein
MTLRISLLLNHQGHKEHKEDLLMHVASMVSRECLHDRVLLVIFVVFVTFISKGLAIADLAGCSQRHHLK